MGSSESCEVVAFSTSLLLPFETLSRLYVQKTVIFPAYSANVKSGSPGVLDCSLLEVLCIIGDALPPGHQGHQAINAYHTNSTIMRREAE